MIRLSNNTTSWGTKTFNDKEKYQGIGPLLGIQGEWDFGCGFGLYGTFVASLLYGKYKVHFNDQDVFTGATNKQIFNVAKRHLTAFDCNTNCALGIKWNVQFCNRYDLKLRLGIEQHQYFNQNRICVGRGDISFIGGVFTLILGF